MSATRRSLVPVSLPFGAAALLVALVATTALLAVTPAPDNAASALQLAFARLHATPSYRMQETILQPIDGLGGTGVITTEIAGNRTRQVVDFDAPGLGVVRVESLRVGAKAAVRADVPAFGSLVASAAAPLEMSEARRLFRQLVGVARSAQIETPASAGMLGLAEAGARARTPAEVRRAMKAAQAWFGIWHPNDRHEIMRNDDTGWSDEVVLIGTERHARFGSVFRYEQAALAANDGGWRARRVVLVEVATGLPVAEEIVSGAGQTLARAEYRDIGASFEIELPGGI